MFLFQHKLLEAHLELAKELVTENIELVTAIAEALLEKRDLDGHEVRRIADKLAVTSKDISIFERSSKILERIKDEEKSKKIKERIEYAAALKAAGGDASEV